MCSVTLKDLRMAGVCFDGYNKVVRMLQRMPFTDEDDQRESYIKFNYDKPISVILILENNGLDDAIWSLRAVDADLSRDCRLFAVWCAQQVEHIGNEQQVKVCNDVIESFINACATVAYTAADMKSAASDVALYTADYASYGVEGAIDKQKEMFIKMCNGQAPWQQ